MAEEGQEKFRREFGQLKSENPKHKSEMQLYTIKNVKKLNDSRQKIIDLFNNYSESIIDLNLFIDRNMMKLREKDLKY